MKKVHFSLISDDKSIEYSIDIEASTFESSITGPDGVRSVVQSGSVGTSDMEKQDLALRMYHILLAALRTSTHERV
jgi:hypothetical protein